MQPERSRASKRLTARWSSLPQTSKGVKKITPMLHKFNYKPVGQPILAEGVVRFVGEAVAAVVASSEEEAEDIADLVELNISESPPLVDARDALAEGAPQLHAEAPGNLIVKARSKPPASTTVWASAAKIIKVDARSHRQNATPIEARAAHAAYDQPTGRVTLTCTTQMPHRARARQSPICSACRNAICASSRPMSAAASARRCRCAPNTCCWCGWRASSKARWPGPRTGAKTLSRRFIRATRYITLEGAFDKDAKLLALRADVVANIGAYSCFPNTAGMEPLMAMAEMPGPYDVQQYQCLARGVLTNTCTMAAYRGVSRPVITFTLERLMDRAAKAFGIDPIDIRRRNLIDKFPYTSATGLVFDEASYKETMEMAVKAIDVPAFARGRSEARGKGRYLGIGFATFSERTGYGSPAFAARGMAITPGWETVHVTVDPSGYVEARIGASPHGQGLRTTLAQIIAEETRHSAGLHQGHSRRYRHRALWLGHFRQPLAGDFRRRHLDRGAESARQADQDRQPYAGSRAGRHRA